ncbi:MAG: thiol:disulfide interchange protein DsbA/DsbL [Ramlibacter sp.]|nr:thiol:disulfide interchange protein DsbA/DsbL [Ramlibacter sp.]
MIDRRRFAFAPLLALATTSLSLPAQAQGGAPVEGQHYITMQPRQPTRDRKQVEVVEFFAYGCSHCHSFEPALDAWQKALPRGVLFRRIPVAFREGPAALHQKLFFAIEALGLVEQLHAKVFHAIHVKHDHLQTPQEIASFLSMNRADAAAVMAAMNGFAVTGKVKQAMLLATGYGIEGTPSIGVDGRWLTDGSMAGSNMRSLVVADYLLAQARRGG